MKKILVGSSVFLALSLSVYTYNTDNLDLSDMQLANVDALAWSIGEERGPDDCSTGCLKEEESTCWCYGILYQDNREGTPKDWGG